MGNFQFRALWEARCAAGAGVGTAPATEARRRRHGECGRAALCGGGKLSCWARERRRPRRGGGPCSGAGARLGDEPRADSAAPLARCGVEPFYKRHKAPARKGGRGQQRAVPRSRVLPASPPAPRTARLPPEPPAHAGLWGAPGRVRAWAPTARPDFGVCWVCRFVFLAAAGKFAGAVSQRRGGTGMAARP